MSWSLPEGVEPLSALPEELSQSLAGLGEPGFRGGQLFKWLHRRGVLDPLEMTDLPARLREHLAADGPLCAARVGRVLRSEDGTRKLEIVLGGGLSVETVLIPDQGKLTQCVSTQVGCAVGCAFCRSGKFGLTRNLSAAEIVAQIHLARGELASDEELRNVVLMGVGEPLHNVARVLRALELLGHPEGLGLSTRRVTMAGTPASLPAQPPGKSAPRRLWQCRRSGRSRRSTFASRQGNRKSPSPAQGTLRTSSPLSRATRSIAESGGHTSTDVTPAALKPSTSQMTCWAPP